MNFYQVTEEKKSIRKLTLLQAIVLIVVQNIDLKI